MRSAPSEVPHLTVEELFDPPERAGASISADGRRIAFLAPWRERLNVWVADADGDLSDARCVTADDNRSVHVYHWADDPRWLLYEQDFDGDENWHLYRVDLDDPGAVAVDLTPFAGVRVMGVESPPSRPGRVLLRMNRRDPAAFDLYEIVVASGETTVLARNPGRAGDFLCTPSGEVYVHGLGPGGDLELSRWAPEAGAAEPLARFAGSDYPLGVHPFTLTPDGTGLWIGSNRHQDRTCLARLDLATGEEAEVDSHPEFDLDTRCAVFPSLPPPLVRDRRTGELIGARYLGARQVIRPLDPHFAAVLENVEKLYGGDIAALSSDLDGMRWVVSFADDRAPGVTYLYDHATGDGRLLFRSRPDLDPAALAPMEPVTIPARDGLSLPSYLTLPVAGERSAIPLVLLVHGGPWSRDSCSFDPAVQLLANRGYAVLQVNFRGSTGFGKAHLKAGIGELAGKMHDDLLDAVRWAVGRDIADPERVAIFGASYGGYAALVGAAFTPDVFAAAIDCFGVSDLANFLRTVPEFVKPHLTNNWYLYAGNPDDPEQQPHLWARSPLSRVDDIRTPLMVVQGANDVRVVQAESDRIVESLRSRGVDVTYLVKPDEGHGFVNPENNKDLFRTADHFLARHLGERTHDRSVTTAEEM
ncbi:S9 family peptidase [Streptomyces sp. NPDC058653]|uniref:S9 family peptidase n=1 Tax=Streptomyces sp. NPDC058653 TaxID=3346576 RepID=UPI0036670098